MWLLVKSIFFTSIIIIPVLITSNIFTFTRKISPESKLLIWTGFGIFLLVVVFSGTMLRWIKTFIQRRDK